MARIRIYIARHLCTAPRPQKEADALAAAGHEVYVHGMSYRPDFAAIDTTIARGRPWRWEPVADFTRPGRRLAWLATRLRHRLAREWYAGTGFVLPGVWGYAQNALAAHALQAPADLTIVHSEGGLAIGSALLRGGHRVGVDFEDWFSQDLPVAHRRGRPVARLAELEAQLLRASPYATTTSAALAAALGAAYGGPLPAVIYNTFPRGAEPTITTTADRPVALHWFSQVIGPSRGLELLVEALPALVFNWVLHLRGDHTVDYEQSLLAPLDTAMRSRVHFHPPVPPADLPAAIANYDIGLVLEESAIPNKNLTIANKVFHYLQSGLAVVASDTAGHRECLERVPEAGIIMPSRSPSALASALNHLGSNAPALLAARRAARRGFVTHLAHEHQIGRYAELAATVLSR